MARAREQASGGGRGKGAASKARVGRGDDHEIGGGSTRARAEAAPFRMSKARARRARRAQTPPGRAVEEEDAEDVGAPYAVRIAEGQLSARPGPRAGELRAGRPRPGDACQRRGRTGARAGIGAVPGRGCAKAQSAAGVSSPRRRAPAINRRASRSLIAAGAVDAACRRFASHGCRIKAEARGGPEGANRASTICARQHHLTTSRAACSGHGRRLGIDLVGAISRRNSGR